MKVLPLLLACCIGQAATLRYWVEPCTPGKSGCHSGDPELAEWALEAWQSGSGGRLTLEKADDRANAHIRVYWANGRAGLFGETRPIVVDGVRGAEVFVLPTVVSDKDALLRDAVVYLTCLHETGHALGLEHTADFEDIMYSFQYGGDIPEYFGRYRRKLSKRRDIRKHSGMSKRDIERLIEQYR